MGKIDTKAKTKLAGATNPIDDEASNSPGNKATSPGLLSATSTKRQAVSKCFRFSHDDIQSLKLITKRVNEESRGTISETKVIKALIELGTKTESSKIIKALSQLL